MAEVMRIGSRRSALALAQTRLFIERCQSINRDITYEIVEMSTAGDRILDRPLYEFAGKGMFVSAFEEALAEGRIDAAVHSGKDMPLSSPEGIGVGAVLPRGNPEDVLVTLRGKELTDMSVIGTGSLRRQEQVHSLLGCRTAGIRGNVITRLEKLKAGEVDGLILAAAGLERLSLLPETEGESEYVFRRLDRRKFLPAAAQGIIAVQCRKDSPFSGLFEKVNDRDTMRCFLAERAFLERMGAGCEQPIAAYSWCGDGYIGMEAAFWKDGKAFRLSDRAKEEEGTALASGLADQIRTAMSHVYLVGAGPGSRDLITVRGMELLRGCDTVIYDRLSGELPGEIREGCERIYVGKQAGKPGMTQGEINELLVRKAREGKRVVRLKGGDPFVFGRGGEEAECLAAAHIPFTVVPGVTSAVAVPELAGIPVTHRELSRSFHVITAHTAERDGEKIKAYLRRQIEGLRDAEGTFVFLMGLAWVETICELFMESGRPPSLPAAVISSGSRYNERIVRGTLADMGERIGKEKLPSPGIFLAGETAALSLKGETVLPLRGKRVGVTGTEEMTERLGKRLREAGAEVLTVQRLFIREPGGQDACFSGLVAGVPDRYTWIVFTSRNGVRLFLDRLLECRTDIRILSGIKLAAIGRGTEKALMERGLRADFVPDIYTAEHLAEGLAGLLSPERDRVLLWQAKDANPAPEKVLRAAGIRADRVSAYETAAGRRCGVEELAGLEYLAFCSSSGVAAFCVEDPHIFQREEMRDVKVFAIGTKTAQALEAAGCKNVRTGNAFTTEHLAEAIIADAAGEAAVSCTAGESVTGRSRE